VGGHQLSLLSRQKYTCVHLTQSGPVLHHLATEAMVAGAPVPTSIAASVVR
jgi:hypothetical protein